jgi:uncharacterized protein (TIGR03437 family)
MTKSSIVCGLLIASGSLFAQQYTISTIAGTAVMPGYTGDQGPALSAQFNTPTRVVSDGKGNLFVTDYGNSGIREVFGNNGTVNSVAGNGSPGFSGDGGSSIGAQLASPHDIALDGKGNLYVADTGNSRIRIINIANLTIKTFAGSGTRGEAGDGGQATSAQLTYPTGVAVDPSGNVYIADSGTASVRKVAPNGTISTFAGTGFLSFGAFIGEGGPATQALLGIPYSLTTDSAGNLYIVDVGLSRLFRIGSDGLIHTVQIDFTGQNCVLDSAGNIYAAVYENHTVQKILPNGTTLWIGGDGYTGYAGDGGVGTSAFMAQPYGVAVDKSGNVYVAEAANAIIRQLTPVPFSIGAISNAATNQPFSAPPTAAGDATVAIAPGEIITLFGTGLGPSTLTVNTLKNGVFGTQLAGTTVMIGGTAAPIVYTSSSLVSAIVPFEVVAPATGFSTTSVYVIYQGQQSVTSTVPLAATAPGIFTASATGSGQALAMNQDGTGTLNSATSPIAIGSYITIYGTGAGQTTPASVDGALAPTVQPFPTPVDTITATVGGFSAVVSYAGAAPGLVDGLLQVNLQIPTGVLPGTAEVILTSNTLSSPPVTIQVAQ